MTQVTIRLIRDRVNMFQSILISTVLTLFPAYIFQSTILISGPGVNTGRPCFDNSHKGSTEVKMGWLLISCFKNSI